MISESSETNGVLVLITLHFEALTYIQLNLRITFSINFGHFHILVANCLPSMSHDKVCLQTTCKARLFASTTSHCQLSWCQPRKIPQSTHSESNQLQSNSHCTPMYQHCTTFGPIEFRVDVGVVTRVWVFPL